MPGSHTQALGGGHPLGPHPTQAHLAKPSGSHYVVHWARWGASYKSPVVPLRLLPPPTPFPVLASREGVPAPCPGSQPHMREGRREQRQRVTDGAVLLCCSLITQLCPILL